MLYMFLIQINEDKEVAHQYLRETRHPGQTTDDISAVSHLTTPTLPHFLNCIIILVNSIKSA